MSDRNHYFDRKEELTAKAYNHITIARNRFWKEITESVLGTTVFANPNEDENWYRHHNKYEYRHLNKDANYLFEMYKYSNEYEKVADRKPFIVVSPDTTDMAIIGNKTSHVTALNFASFKNPGGKFLSGSSAQEEMLCHASCLYNILSDFDNIFYEYNRDHLNRALYHNRALYSPGIVFFSETDSFNPLKADILTCAAPNWSNAGKIGCVPYSANVETLGFRIEFLLKCAVLGSLEASTDYFMNGREKVLILGAFGCGVFGQDPKIVSHLFKTYINLGLCNHFNRIIFAIPYGENYNKFVETFSE